MQTHSEMSARVEHAMLVRRARTVRHVRHHRVRRLRACTRHSVRALSGAQSDRAGGEAYLRLGASVDRSAGARAQLYARHGPPCSAGGCEHGRLATSAPSSWSRMSSAATSVLCPTTSARASTSLLVRCGALARTRSSALVRSACCVSIGLSSADKGGAGALIASCAQARDSPHPEREQVEVRRRVRAQRDGCDPR